MLDIKRTLLDVFVSPNESDRNGENANVVDGLFFIGRAIEKLAEAIKEKKDA